MRAKHLMSRTGYSGSGMPAPSMPPDMGSMPMPDDSAPAPMPTMKTGGAVEGRASGGRLDKMARGGAKGKPNVTINILAGDKGSAPTPMPPPPPMPMPPPPPPGPMAGPGPGAGGLPMGPGGMKTGGRMKKRAEGGGMGEPTQGYSTKKIPPPPTEKHLASGGRLGGKAAPKMDDGSGSGEGRLEKIKAYGTKPKAK